MHKSFKHFALAGAAMTLALSPAMAGAQDQSTTGSTPQPGTGTPPTSPDPTRTGTATGDDAAGTGEAAPPSDPRTPDTGSTPDANAAEAGEATAQPPTDTTGTQTGDDTGTAATTGTGTTNVMTRSQQQAAIKTWPRETQAYYNSLSTARQNMFWALSDTDKVRLGNLTDAQKEQAWTQIEAQINPPRG